MQAPVTPYIWRYQPETGNAAGARQDYGSVINWLGSDPRMYSRVQAINQQRNDIINQDTTVNRIGFSHNFNNWPSHELYQPMASSYIPATRTDISPHTVSDFVATAEGVQLAGAGYQLGDGRKYRKLTRDALPFPRNWQVFEDGEWKNITGGSANATSSYPQLVYEVPKILKYSRPGQQLQGSGFRKSNNLHLLSEESRRPRYGGMTPLQFSREFSPVTYNNPFDGSVLKFPKEFNPLFTPANDFRATNDSTLQYRRGPII